VAKPAQVDLFAPSIRNTFKDNIFSQNSQILTADWQCPNYIQDFDSSNLADEQPIYYWIDRQDQTVPKTQAGLHYLIAHASYLKT
jgi:hypothetical protein